MGTNLKNHIDLITEEAIAFCSEKGLHISFTNEISNSLLEEISTRTKEYPNMYNASIDTLQNRIKNGCIVLTKKNQLYGHIFAHKHVVDNYAVFERSSLWIHPDYRNNNLGLLLMKLLTEKFKAEFVISIAQEPIVHRNNELLGMQKIALSEMSPVLIQALEKLGKLRDELKYRYYVNPYFEKKIHQLNKILNKVSIKNKK